MLTYTGDTKGRGDSVTLAARLTDAAGSPVVGEEVTFEIAGRTFAAVTDGNGVARTAATIPDHGKSQSVIVRYAGNADYASSEASAIIVWGNKK